MSTKNTKPPSIFLQMNVTFVKKKLYTFMFFDCVAHIYPAGKNDVAPKWAN